MKRTILVAMLVMGFAGGFSTTGFTQDKASEAYVVDKGHSAVLFKVKHANAAYFYGQFLDFSGTIAESTKGLDVKYDVKTASVFTNIKKRDDHLKSPDFFNSKEFPTLSFQSTKSTRSGENYNVTGNLTLNGKTKPVSFTVVPTGTGKNQEGKTLKGYHTEFTIKRSDFGINFMVGAGLADEVTIIISSEAVAK